jgi:hypothetical protein
MPQLHPALAEFQTELEHQGFVVVNHGDYICVRLPLVASVRIHLNAGHLHFEPRFGTLSRGMSLVVTPITALLLVAGVGAVASIPATILAAFVGALTVLYEVSRVVMTEGAMTRLQLLWTTRPPPRDALEGADAKPAIVAPRPAAAALVGGAAGQATERASQQPVQSGDRLRSGH